MLDAAPMSTAVVASGTAQMWKIHAMDFDGFYGTQIVVCAPGRDAAARQATREAVRFARERLATVGFAYGMSSADRDLEAKIAARADVFLAEARKSIAPLTAGAVTLRAPGYSA